VISRGTPTKAAVVDAPMHPNAPEWHAHHYRDVRKNP
jgi:hypothetical protein